MRKIITKYQLTEKLTQFQRLFIRFRTELMTLPLHEEQLAVLRKLKMLLFAPGHYFQATYFAWEKFQQYLVVYGY